MPRILGKMWKASLGGSLVLGNSLGIDMEKIRCIKLAPTTYYKVPTCYGGNSLEDRCRYYPVLMQCMSDIEPELRELHTPGLLSPRTPGPNYIFRGSCPMI